MFYKELSYIVQKTGRLSVVYGSVATGTPDESLNWRPNRYRVELPYTVHDFTFGVVKLLDYRAWYPLLHQAEF